MLKFTFGSHIHSSKSKEPSSESKGFFAAKGIQTLRPHHPLIDRRQSGFKSQG